MFLPGQKVLLFDSQIKLFLGKFKSKWSKPYTAREVKFYAAVVSENEANGDVYNVNGQRLKIYMGGEVHIMVTSLDLKNPN